VAGATRARTLKRELALLFCDESYSGFAPALGWNRDINCGIRNPKTVICVIARENELDELALFYCHLGRIEREALRIDCDHSIWLSIRLLLAQKEATCKKQREAKFH